VCRALRHGILDGVEGDVLDCYEPLLPSVQCGFVGDEMAELEEKCVADVVLEQHVCVAIRYLGQELAHGLGPRDVRPSQGSRPRP
jgi:hypothetical protein